MARALETGAAAVVMLSFLAVGREGVETALFMVGYAEADTAWPLAGLLAGVLVAVGITWAMYAGAVRINLAKFFTYTGVFLVVVAAGILSYGLGALQTVGWLPGAGHKAFDISAWFNWSAWYGEILRGVFNITPTPTVLQLVCWLAYLGIVLAFFFAESAPRSRLSAFRRSGRTLDGASRARTVAIVLAAGVVLAACTGKDGRPDAVSEVRVTATDTECTLSSTEGRAGTTTFLITNNGTKVTEFYVYGPGGRERSDSGDELGTVVGEVENISPGVHRELAVPLTEASRYEVACKPGMTGDGIRTAYTVTG